MTHTPTNSTNTLHSNLSDTPYSLHSIDNIREQAVAKHIPVLHKEKAQQLWDLIQTIKPKKVIELGTAIGYSGLILTHTHAQLISIDTDAIALQQAQELFQRYHRQATVMHCDGIVALETLIANAQTADIVFIDFAKKKYLPAYELAKKIVVKGGYIICDNVCMPVLSEFLTHVMQDTSCVTTVLEIGDGLLLSEFIGKDSSY
jgi:predicted O-methyltransferase YrrM